MFEDFELDDSDDEFDDEKMEELLKSGADLGDFFNRSDLSPRCVVLSKRLLSILTYTSRSIQPRRLVRANLRRVFSCVLSSLIGRSQAVWLSEPRGIIADLLLLDFISLIITFSHSCYSMKLFYIMDLIKA